MNPIYEPKGKAKEYGDLAINIYTGCNHGCTYCYAPSVLRKDKAEFAQVKVRPGVVDAVKKQLGKEVLKNKMIHLCFTCDPYPADIDTAATREIIKAIKGSGNHVQILTKGGYRAVRDFDLLDRNDRFGVTISAMFNQSAEPNAAFPIERITTLKTAKDAGFYTWVSCEPVLDAGSIYRVIRDFDFIDLYKIGKLNYHPSDINWHDFGHECERLCKKYGRNYYIKEDLRREMETVK